MATAYQWHGVGSGAAGEGYPEKVETRVANRPRPHLVTRPARADKKPPIVELYTVKRIDNSRLVRHVEPVKLRNLYKTVALGTVIAVCFLVYIYQHFHCIDLSFQLEEMKAKQVQAQSLNSELKLEIATLRDPHRIDVIAQQQLGLIKPLPVQVREYASVDGAEVALVRYVQPNRTP
ncbi:MAG TPA: hypothetical protein VEI54_05120 [Candidatus Limnocylindrales bacterium]|nr:hypothetical protein [Candidatus Limnocylindrales bacterium]